MTINVFARLAVPCAHSPCQVLHTSTRSRARHLCVGCGAACGVRHRQPGGELGRGGPAGRVGLEAGKQCRAEPRRQRVGVLERARAGERLIQRRGEGIHVGGRAHPGMWRRAAARALLRRHVRQRPDHVVQARGLGHAAGDTEVQQARARRRDDVLRLDVEMDPAALRQPRHGQRQRRAERRHRRRAQRPPRAQQVTQRGARDVLHEQVGVATAQDDVKAADDARAREVRERRGLVDEHAARVAACNDRRPRELGDATPEADVVDEEDLVLGAATEAADDRAAGRHRCAGAQLPAADRPEPRLLRGRLRFRRRGDLAEGLKHPADAAPRRPLSSGCGRHSPLLRPA